MFMPEPTSVTWWLAEQARQRLAERLGSRFAHHRLVELVFVEKRVRCRVAEFRQTGRGLTVYESRPGQLTSESQQALAEYLKIKTDPMGYLFSPKRLGDIVIDYKEHTICRRGGPIIGLGFQVAGEDIEAELARYETPPAAQTPLLPEQSAGSPESEAVATSSSDEAVIFPTVEAWVDHARKNIPQGEMEDADYIRLITEEGEGRVKGRDRLNEGTVNTTFYRLRKRDP
jgi:hypothetical protein